MTEDQARFHIGVAMMNIPFMSMLSGNAQDGLREEFVTHLKEQGALEDKIKCRNCNNPIIKLPASTSMRRWTHQGGDTVCVMHPGEEEGYAEPLP